MHHQLIIDMYIEAAEAALQENSQISALKYVHCQNLYVDTTLTNITSKNVCKCSACGETWYES